MNEGVEVAGPAGTDLTGWKVLFYNGNGGLAYDSVSLSGTLPGQQNGFGTLWRDAPGSLQNGPDGLALISAGGQVIQFLTYEGSFPAMDGSAAGITGTDIGVEESGATEAGQSLQLEGQGSVYGDFTWVANRPATPGAVNTGQVFGTALDEDSLRLVRPLAQDTLFAGDRVILAWASAAVDSIRISLFGYPGLEMEFNERVYPGIGSIAVYGDNGGLCERVDIAGEQIRFDTSAYTVEVMLSSSLPGSVRHHVRVDAGAIRDYQDNAFSGFSSDTVWTFTTTPATGSHLSCWEDPANGQIRIYPNPAEEEVTLEWYGTAPGPVEVEIIDTRGVTVYRNSYPSVIRLREHISLQDLATGLYLLRVSTAEGLSLRWLMVNG